VMFTETWTTERFVLFLSYKFGWIMHCVLEFLFNTKIEFRTYSRNIYVNHFGNSLYNYLPLNLTHSTIINPRNLKYFQSLENVNIFGEGLLPQNRAGREGYCLSYRSLFVHSYTLDFRFVRFPCVGSPLSIRYFCALHPFMYGRLKPVSQIQLLQCVVKRNDPRRIMTGGHYFT
jgi:hypothetical protein